MVFYICMGLAVIITAAGIISTALKLNLVGRPESPIHTVLAISLINTCILYIPWFLYSWQSGAGDFKNNLLIVPFMIIRLMQTVSMDADYESAIEIAYLAQTSGVSATFLQFYCIVLSYFSVLVPLSGILSVAGLFGNQIGYRVAAGRLSGKKRLMIFNGTGQRNLQLAESIFEREGKNAKNCSFLFCNVHEDPGVAAKRQIKKMKGWYTAEYPSLLLRAVRYRRTRTLHFFLLEEEERNFKDVTGILRAAQILSEGREHWPEAERVRVHLLIESDQYENLLDAQEKYGIFVRIMDTERMCVQELFKKWPLFAGLQSGKKTINLLILGQGGIAANVLYNALWMGQTTSASLKVCYLGEDADSLRDRMHMTCPALLDPGLSGGLKYDLVFEDIADREQLRLHEREFPDTDYIVIAFGDDEVNIRTAMWVRTWIARQKPEDAAQPFIAVCIRGSRHARTAEKLCVQESGESYDFHVFGTDSRLFTAENILYNRLDRILYMVQLSYLLDDPDSEPTKEQKDEAARQLNRSVYNFRSSEAGAQYIVNRLFDSGAIKECLRREAAGAKTDAAAGAGPAAEETGDISGYDQAGYWAQALEASEKRGDRERLDRILSVYEELIDDPRLVERLAKAEHNRWVTYMAVNGWIPLPKEQLESWADRHKGGHKDYLRLRHAAMVRWEDLDIISEIITGGRDPEKIRNSDRKIVTGTGKYLSK